MSFRRGLRTTIKRGGAVMTVLLLIVWAETRRSPVVCVYSKVLAAVGSGALVVQWDNAMPPENFRIGRAVPHGAVLMRWWFKLSVGNGPNIVRIPIWAFVTLAAIPTFFIWRQDRKPIPGLCHKCGYSMTGLPSERACPECGAQSVSSRYS